jgi:hypothetical protein
MMMIQGWPYDDVHHTNEESSTKGTFQLLFESSTEDKVPQDASVCIILVSLIHIPVCTCFTKKQAAPGKIREKITAN